MIFAYYLAYLCKYTLSFVCVNIVNADRIEQIRENQKNKKIKKKRKDFDTYK